MLRIDVIGTGAFAPPMPDAFVDILSDSVEMPIENTIY